MSGRLWLEGRQPSHVACFVPCVLVGPPRPLSSPPPPTPPPSPAAVTSPSTAGNPQYTSYAGFAHLGAGLSCGLSSLAAGLAIGVVGDAGVRATGQNEKLFVGMILILIFAEALGLYGLIVALIMSQKGDAYKCPA